MCKYIQLPPPPALCGCLLPLFSKNKRTTNEHLRNKISEVRSGTHNNGGRNPDWTRKNNFFTFYVPSNVPLSNLAVVLEVYDSNSVSSDKLIGTCGKIPLNGVSGRRKAGATDSNVWTATCPPFAELFVFRRCCGVRLAIGVRCFFSLSRVSEVFGCASKQTSARSGDDVSPLFVVAPLRHAGCCRLSPVASSACGPSRRWLYPILPHQPTRLASL